jgi:hypothetical protein
VPTPPCAAGSVNATGYPEGVSREASFTYLTTLLFKKPFTINFFGTNHGLYSSRPPVACIPCPHPLLAFLATPRPEQTLRVGPRVSRCPVLQPETAPLAELGPFPPHRPNR